jgi:hypothetical protein
LQYLTFSYIKDVVYRPQTSKEDLLNNWAHDELNYWEYQSYDFTSWLDENVMFGKYIKNQGFTTNEYSYTVTLGNPVWPWNRAFEVRFDVTVQ